jgi:hypothetical protein
MMKEMAIFDKELSTADMKDFIGKINSMQDATPEVTSVATGVTGGKINKNCTVYLPPSGNATAPVPVPGDYCYNGVYTGPNHDGGFSALQGAGESLECTVSSFKFKFGIRTNNSAANTGL